MCLISDQKMDVSDLFQSYDLLSLRRRVLYVAGNAFSNDRVQFAFKQHACILTVSLIAVFTCLTCAELFQPETAHSAADKHKAKVEQWSAH